MGTVDGLYRRQTNLRRRWRRRRWCLGPVLQTGHPTLAGTSR